MITLNHHLPFTLRPARPRVVQVARHLCLGPPGARHRRLCRVQSRTGRNLFWPDSRRGLFWRRHPGGRRHPGRRRRQNQGRLCVGVHGRARVLAGLSSGQLLEGAGAAPIVSRQRGVLAGRHVPVLGVGQRGLGGQGEGGCRVEVRDGERESCVFFVCVFFSAVTHTCSEIPPPPRYLFFC